MEWKNMANLEYTRQEIAKKLNLDQQQVYRFIKSNRIEPVGKKGKSYLYSSVTFDAVKSAFNLTGEEETHSNDEFLIEQLREKDKQIANLSNALDQAQKLQLVAENKVQKLELKMKSIDIDSGDNADIKPNSQNINDDIEETKPKQKKKHKFLWW